MQLLYDIMAELYEQKRGGGLNLFLLKLFAYDDKVPRFQGRRLTEFVSARFQEGITLEREIKE